MRGRQAKTQYRKTRSSALVIQSFLRRQLHRRRYRRYRRAVVRLQAHFRRISVQRSHNVVAEGRRKWRSILGEREAVVLQVRRPVCLCVRRRRRDCLAHALALAHARACALALALTCALTLESQVMVHSHLASR